MIRLARTFAIRTRRKIGTISFVGSSTAAASSVSMPGGIAAGDIAVFFDYALEGGGVIPTDVAPSGFTRIGASQTAASTAGVRWNQFYKVLTGGETTVSGMSALVTGKNLLVFRIIGSGAWGAPSSVGQEVSIITSTVSDKTVTVGTAPLVVLGCIFGGNSGDLDMTPSSPTAEQNLDTGSGFVCSGYLLGNTSPVNTTVTSADTASMRAIAGFYIPLV